MRRLLVLLTALIAFTAGTVTPAQASGDDYPWKLDRTWSLDTWGFTKRQCVSWVAWRMSQRGVILNNWRHNWGSAHNWDNAARRMRHGIGPKAVKGAIAHWNPGERAAWYANGSSVPNGWITAGPYGHVGYVQGVHADGSAVVTQYNLSGSRTYSIVRVRAPRYLYVSVPAPR
jgi:surface antigen